MKALFYALLALLLPFPLIASQYDARDYAGAQAGEALLCHDKELRRFVLGCMEPNGVEVLEIGMGSERRRRLQLPLEAVSGARYIEGAILLWGVDARGSVRFFLQQEEGGMKDVTPFAAQRWAEVQAVVRYNGSSRLLVKMGNEPKADAHLFLLDVAGSPPSALLFHPNRERAISWAFGENARPVAALRWEPDGGKTLLALQGSMMEKPRELLHAGADDRLQLLGKGKTENTVYIIHDIGLNAAALSELDLNTGERRDLVTDMRADVSFVLSGEDGLLLGASVLHERHRYHALQPCAAVNAALAHVQARFGESDAVPLAVSADMRRVLLRVAVSGGETRHWVYDMGSGGMQSLSPPRSVPPVRPVLFSEYPAADGTMIPVYYVLPRGKPPFPVVVFVHGGPQTRTDASYDWRVQYLASRGYAVAQPQFRGSRGWGKDFMLAGSRQWGLGVMQTDVNDCIPWLVEQGIARSDSIAIFGGSYGGYAAVAGLCFYPGLYACGASFFGPQDLEAFVTYSDPANAAYAGADRRHIGDPDIPKELAWLRAASPILHAERIKAPLFLYYGEKDVLVPPEHSRRLARALKAAGKTVEEHSCPDEAHGFINPSLEPCLYELIVSFLQRNMPQLADGGRDFQNAER